MVRGEFDFVFQIDFLWGKGDEKTIDCYCPGIHGYHLDNGSCCLEYRAAARKGIGDED